MQVGVLVNPGFLATSVASVFDVLTTADALRSQVAETIAPIEVELVASTKNVEGAGPLLATSSAPLSSVGDHDVTIVAASAGTTIGEIDSHLESSAGVRTRRILAKLDESATVAAACTGTFYLAAAGQLDEHRATTSWWLGPQFANRFPAVKLDTTSMVVTDGPRITAGAAFAHVDLALAIVSSLSVELAAVTSRFMLIDDRPSQSAFAAIGFLSVTDEIALEFEKHVRAHLAEPLTIADVAETLGVARRTLERRVRRAFGDSPLSVIQELRIERARHLQLLGTTNMDDIATAVGYRNATTLRNLLRSGPSH